MRISTTSMSATCVSPSAHVRLRVQWHPEAGVQPGSADTRAARIRPGAVQACRRLAPARSLETVCCCQP